MAGNECIIISFIIQTLRQMPLQFHYYENKSGERGLCNEQKNV
jgi:hypothetical protein